MAQQKARGHSKKTSKSLVRDKKGDVVIWQQPNVWLVAWVVCTVLFFIGAAGGASKYLFGLGALSLTVWAMLELLRGVNLLRRVLGGVALLVIIGLARHIAAVVFG